MADEDELARQRAERTRHPSTLPALPDPPPIAPTEDYALDIDTLPSVVRARLDALQGLVAEAVDELERRGIRDIADRLRGGLP